MGYKFSCTSKEFWNNPKREYKTGTKMKITYKTKRLTLRFVETSDFESWKKAQLSALPPKNKNDRRVDPKLVTKAVWAQNVRESKSDIKSDQRYMFGVFSKKNELLGFVSLMNVHREISQNAFLGYFIYNNHWGQGYGKEAVKAAIKIGFNKLNLHRIEAAIQPTNKRSLALAKSVGMRFEGLSKRRLYFRDQGWKDFTVYAITSEEIGIKHKMKKK